MSLEILIITYNNEDTIENAIKSIIDQDFKGLSIKIFDNASKDTTNNIVKRISIKSPVKINHIRNIKNIGFGKACNYLARSSKANNILFMNPDIQIETKDTLKTIVDKLNSTDIKIVGVTHNDYSNIARTKGVIGSINRHTDRVNIQPETNECLYISGGFLGIKNETLVDVNYFDERYFMYYEDFDLALKVHSNYKNCKIINLDNYIVKHKFQGSNIDREIRMQYILESQKLFNDKWGGCNIHVD